MTKGKYAFIGAAIGFIGYAVRYVLLVPAGARTDLSGLLGSATAGLVIGAIIGAVVGIVVGWFTRPDDQE